jgi:MFS transporter, ACS family, D-galactonate transporter
VADAIYLALPNWMHREYAVRALEAGWAVPLEKPMARSLEDCLAIEAAARSSGTKLMIMSVAFFCQGLTNLGWTLISDVAPKNLMGLTGGVFNFAANLAGIITPVVIGIVVSATGSFFGGLFYTGVVALIGALSYIFIVGDVK